MMLAIYIMIIIEIIIIIIIEQRARGEAGRQEKTINRR